MSTPLPARPRARRLAGIALLAVTAAGCSSSPLDTGVRQQTVEFSATGSSGDAYGRYVLVGDLSSNEIETFNGLPFTRTLTTSTDAAPKMAVSLVSAAPGSMVSCRITINGRVVVSRTAPAPGPDVECQAP